MASDFFSAQAGAPEIQKEKEKARVLRKTRWWRQKIAKGVCHYCGGRFPAEELTMDHIVPLVRGGKTAKGNVAPVCKDCNSKKKYLLPMEWQAYLDDFRERK